ncbi:MAG: type II secretion system GspH family protein [Roseburia sp.]|nr:type II secretion system GspH family protein [Roseburia sp.]
MKFFRKRILKLGNKGLSMVELICAIAILGFLGTTVSGMMVVSANSYLRGSSETEVQQEAQLVANQINDLLIDAKEIQSYSSGRVEILLKDDSVNVVKYNASSKELIFVDASGDEQVMAQGVEVFQLNADCVDTFKETGNVQLTIQFVNNNQEYPAVFATTGRNVKTERETRTSGAMNMTLTQWLLEPNQSKDFSSCVSVSGVEGGLSWAVQNSSSATGSTTISSTGLLTVGSDEMSSNLKVHVKTNKIEGGLPVAEGYIDVYIRRVTDLPLTLTWVPGSGSSGKAGAEYIISYGLAGNYLEQVAGAEYDDDYIDPRNVDWEVSLPAGMTSADYTMTAGATGYRFKLNRDITSGQIAVTAKAAHTYGSLNGVQTNKSGVSYGDLHKTVTIAGPGPFNYGDGWMRQSDKEQASVDSDFYNDLKSRFGGSVRAKYIFRFRKVGDTEWDGWHENTSGDGNDSMSINLRPMATGIMDYRYAYEVQIRFSMVDSAGNEVWPAGDPSIPEDHYLISHVVEKVSLLFTGNSLGLDADKGSVCCPMATAATVHLGSNQTRLMEYKDFSGLEGKDLKNNIRFIFERKTGATWTEVNDNQQLEVQNNQGSLYVTARGNFIPGLYRVKVWVENAPKYKFGANDRVENDGSQNMILYDESTGDGIFYMNLER